VSEPSASSDRRLGPFLLHTLLGRGGGGEAWAGVHGPTGTEVVVKRSLPGSLASAERLDQEIAHTCQVDHPHLVRVLDARRHVVAAGASGIRETLDEPYLVVNRALRGTLADHRLSAHPAALATALFDALAGLAHLHSRGFLHLDVKPANLFVHDDRGPLGTIARATALVQVGDLGASLPRSRSALRRSAPGALMGTPGYSAPEHRAGDFSRLGPWSDLWSLGATAWRLAGQTSGFSELRAGDEARAAGDDTFAELLRWLLPWCRRCAASEPDQRFRSAVEAAEALAALGASADRDLFSRLTKTPIASVALTEAADRLSRAARGGSLADAGASDRGLTQTASFAGVLTETPLVAGPFEDREDATTIARGREPTWAAPSSQPSRDPASSPALAGMPLASAPIESETERDLPLGLGAGAAAIRRPPLVGRRVLGARLRELWRGVIASRQGRVVVLEGPSGVGLSRLAEWIGEFGHEGHGAVVLNVALGQGSGGLEETLRQWIVGVGVSRESAGLAGKSAAEAGTRDWAAAHVRARLGAEGLLSETAPETSHPLVDGFVPLLLGRRRTAPQLAALFEHFVRRLRASRPLVLLVDALEGARGPLIWLEHTASQLTRPPPRDGQAAFVHHGALLVVTQSTPLVAGTGFGALRLDPEVLAQVVTEPVAPLDRYQTERLASRLLGFADRTSQEVAARSRGLPAHLVAHVATWLQQGILVTGPAGLTLALEPGEEPPAPPSLTDAVLQRFTRVFGVTTLEGKLRQTLAVAALFDLDDVPLSSAVDEVLVRRRLPPVPIQALREAGLVLGGTVEGTDEPAGGAARWALPGLGDALLLDRAEAPAVYLACAEALERFGPAGHARGATSAGESYWDGTRGLSLARWFARGKQPARALATLGRILPVDLDPDTVRGLLELLERLAVGAGDGWSSPEDSALSAALSARMHFERGDHERARAEARRAREILVHREHHVRERATRVATDLRVTFPRGLLVAAQLHALHVLSLAQATEGQRSEPADALAMAAEAEQWAEGAGADELLTARSLRGRLLIITSRSVEAISVMQHAIEQGAEAAPATQWRAWILLADACTNAGHPERALPSIARAVAAMTASGGHWMLGQAQNTLADGLMRQRRFDEALVPLRAALAEFYPRTPTAGYVRANIAFCCLCLGRLEEAEAWVEEGLARLATDARHRLWCLLQSLRLPVLAARRDQEKLDETIEELERWLSTQRLIFAEPAEAATLAGEALPADDVVADATRTRLFVLARRLTEHVEDERLRARLEPRWGGLRGDD
jgi:tetratricopeptide (TPR) repeat protein